MFDFTMMQLRLWPHFLIFTGEGSPPFEMTVTMVVAKYPAYAPVEDGKGTVTVPASDIAANTRIVQRFNGVNQNGELLTAPQRYCTVQSFTKRLVRGCENAAGKLRQKR